MKTLSKQVGRVPQRGKVQTSGPLTKKDNTQLTCESSIPKLVLIKNDKPMTSSMKLAETFGKQHKNVIRRIERELESLPEEFSRDHIELSTRDTKRGQTKQYWLTRQGFLAVATTFAGVKAATLRAEVIKQFMAYEEKTGITNEMVAKLFASMLEKEDKIKDAKISGKQIKELENAINRQGYRIDSFGYAGHGLIKRIVKALFVESYACKYSDLSNEDFKKALKIIPRITDKHLRIASRFQNNNKDLSNLKKVMEEIL